MDVLGPVPQHISKIKDEYRWLITVRSDNADILKTAVNDTYSKMRQNFEALGIYINPKII